MSSYDNGMEAMYKESLYRLSQQQMARRKWADAIQTLEKLVDRDPEYMDAAARLREATMRRKYALVLDPLDAIRPRALSLGQFVSLLASIVILAGCGAGALWARSAWPGRFGGTPTPSVALAVTEPATATIEAPPLLESPSPTPAAQDTLFESPLPTSTIEAPSPTATLSPTVEPTATPTDTPTPEPPTDTPTPAPPTATPTPAPTPTAELTGRIVFPLWDPKREMLDIYIAGVDGSNQRLLIDEASQPDVSLDGRMIAYRSWSGSERGIIVQGLDGSQRQRLSNGLEDADPHWYPDEARIIYHSRVEIDRRERLYDVGTWAGAAPMVWKQGTEVVFGDAPTWLGKARIVYNQCLSGGCSLRAMNRDGSDDTALVSNFSVERLIPAGSPLGAVVAFAAWREGNWDIYLLDVASGQAQRVTDDPAEDVLPAWVPDGSRLLFVSSRGGGWAIWAMNADGSGQQQLFALGGSLEGAFPHEDTYMGWIEERIVWVP